MALALSAAFFANRLFASYSMPWVLMIIIAYILKDRIKEILRSIAERVLPRIVSDRSQKLVDQKTSQKVGVIRETVDYCRENDIPKEVAEKRTSVENPLREMLPPENVIRLRTWMRIATRKIRTVHARAQAITSIQRLCTDPWLIGMDEPTSMVPKVENGKVTKVIASRVYHVYLIVMITGKNQDESPRVFQKRIVVDREGIVRIEEFGYSNAKGRP